VAAAAAGGAADAEDQNEGFLEFLREVRRTPPNP
jgi:hypothetical protein